MARITVEDCILKIPNRFDLVLAASQRARDISAGAPLTVDRDNDKNPVVSLREIAEETVEVDALNEALIQGLQRHVEHDEPEEEDLDLLTVGEGLGLTSQEETHEDGRSLIEEEIADDVLAVGEDAIEQGADIEQGDDLAEDEAESQSEDEQE